MIHCWKARPIVYHIINT